MSSVMHLIIGMRRDTRGLEKRRSSSSDCWEMELGKAEETVFVLEGVAISFRMRRPASAARSLQSPHVRSVRQKVDVGNLEKKECVKSKA